MATLRFLTGIYCLLISSMLTSGVTAQFVADSKWVPDQANCLVLINSSQIFNSPLAMKENWAAQRVGAFERGLSVVPTNSGRVMLASQIDYDSIEPIWTVGVFYDPESAIDLQSVANRYEQQMEKLGDRGAVSMPGDHYLIELAPKLLGVKAPANRQAASRWIQDSESGKSRMSPYLNDALSYADRNAHVIIAFDLSDAISEADALSRLIQFEGQRASDVEGFAKAASRLEGVTLGVTVREAIVGSLRIDFKPGTEGLDRVKKDLVLDILSSRGLMIDDLLDWDLTAEASRLVLKGPLTSTGLRKVSLLINQPVRAQLTGASPGDAQAQKEISVGRATRHYIDTLTLFMNELDEFVQNPRHKHANVYARWFDKYANKIDSLSVVGIDQEMLSFGSEMSTGIRDVSRVLTSAEAITRSRQTTERGGIYWSDYGNGYGYGYRRSNAAVQQAIRTQETAAAASQAKESMQKLRELLGDSRRKMSVKYPQDF